MKELLRKFAQWICQRSGIIVCRHDICDDVTECQRLTEENAQLCEELSDLSNEFSIREEEYIEKFYAYRQLANVLARKCRNAGIVNDEEIYAELSCVFDPNGWKLYSTARKILDCKKAYHYFPIEDSLGYFEETNGFGDLRWLETTFFGECTYLEVQPGVEIVKDVSFSERKNELNNFRKRLFDEVVAGFLGPTDTQRSNNS